MHTIAVNLYTFEELAPQMQQQVVERESSINIEDAYWYEPIIEDWTQQLENLGFEQVKILFTGFGTQGDGACFEANVNITEYLRAHHVETQYPLLAQYPEYVDVSLKHRGRYSHERSTHLVPSFNADVVNLDGTGISDEEARVEQEYAALEKDIFQETVRLGRAIYKALEDEFSHQISAAAVQDTLIANEYTYLSDGRRFRMPSPA